MGKTTLFKLILGELAAGGDEISLPKTARIGSVAQEHPATPFSVLDTILEADVERHTLMGRLETAPPEELGEIWARLIDIDADSAPSRASEILAGLGFSQDDQQRPMSEFSGGWRMRVALAAALFANRTCCCSTNRPTISIWKARCGWRIPSGQIPAHRPHHQPRP